MTRPKVLFLISNLESGGVSKSMVSLLSAFDRKRYEVSLWIGSPYGLFYDLLPDDIIRITDRRIAWLMAGPKGIFRLLAHGHLLLACGNLFRMFISFFDKGIAGWILSRLMPVTTDQEYDLIVDYNGQHQLYYMIDKLKGKKEVTFFHSDYSKWPYYYRMDRKYFPKVDRIFTISATCLKTLSEFFPTQKDKMFIMENITSPGMIRKLAEGPADDFNGEIRLLTIGHVCHQKGSDLAIEAASILKKRGVPFRWYFIGKPSDQLEDMTRRYGVSDEVVFLGLRANPYPYLKNATIYVHPSRYEGKSIALDEAKILCKPIVVTNFSTVSDQFENRVNASICNMTPENLAETISELLQNLKLRESYVQYLTSHIIDNSGEIAKLYTLIES